MMYNLTMGLWITLIGGQEGNTTVEFFITAMNDIGEVTLSTIYSYDVKALPIGDINGDGTVNMQDIFIITLYFGEST